MQFASFRFFEEVQEVLLEFDCKKIDEVIDLILRTQKNKGRIFVAGLGGSLATASHFAGDLMKYSSSPKRQFTAICLTDNQSLFTAHANDSGLLLSLYGVISSFKPISDDTLVLFSVHGGDESTSQALVECAQYAQSIGMNLVAITGFDGGRIGRMTKFHINVKSTSTPIIEGLHSLIAHAIAEGLRVR